MEYSVDILPYRRLCAGILARAVQDWFIVCDGDKTILVDMSGNGTHKIWRIGRLEMLEWFNSPLFVLCCDVLGIHPDDARHALFNPNAYAIERFGLMLKEVN